ncbi:MAG: UDP-3-O-(3-hydroxymyristoyl)glucosamine N-acyltransferase [Phycisphaerales bacterium]|nr:UDP-3-O-(3-hydroxymyristoyl)glucosamine N-acyltransferase [Phycisphaerales bacterium]
MSKSYTLAEIAKWVGGVVRGDAGRRITGVSCIAEASPTEITWLAHDKYIPELRSSRAAAVVVHERFGETPMPAILVADPELAMTGVLDHFAEPVPRPPMGVHPTACVAATASLGPRVAVGPYAVIGENVRIGEQSVIHAHVVIGEQATIGRTCELWPGVVVRERCRLGDRVIVHANTTIGADGFGYRFTGTAHAKVPQIGIVEIGDDVEIGANCCIDRAKFGSTRVGSGTKIDNLVQIAHNVRIGESCLIVAQCGIAGSTHLGRGVVLGGQVGVRDHVHLHDGVQAAACCCISKDVPARTVVNGIPAIDNRQYLREQATVRKLPQMADQIKDLIKRIEQLESTTDH